MFNPEKLEWFNNQHMMRLPAEKLARRIEPLLRAAGMWAGLLRRGPAVAARVIELLKPRAHRLGDFVPQAQTAHGRRHRLDAAAVDKHLAPAGTRGHVAAIAGALASLGEFAAAPMEPAVRAWRRRAA